MKLSFSRLSLAVIFMLAIFIVLCAAWLTWRVRSSFPLLDGTIAVQGISAPVEVLRDAHGVPHIRAKSIADALFAQGYVMAQDRLWQMDLSRRKGEGQLAEIFGQRALKLDIESRTLGLPQLAEAGLADLPPDERELLSSYTRGVNAFIESHRNRLPLEFLLLRYQPRSWRNVDSVAVTLNLATALSESWEADLMRERIAGQLPKQLFSDLFPDRSPLDMPVADVPASTPEKLNPNNPHQSSSAVPEQSLAEAFSSIEANSIEGQGSNNWVIGGSHTKSGKPLLANDPHLAHSIPSVWYMNQLEAPGLNVTGVSLAGLPLVVIGHNERIAWGMTNTGADVQDLYVETFDSANPRKYLHAGQWLNAEVHDETIKVRGQSDFHLQVKTTQHGPIISHDGNRELALQWTLRSPHGVGLPFLQINQAGNWQEFTGALRGWAVPMLNCVYADVEGNIGFYAAGLVPIRKKGNGSVPVPGNTDEYEWTGFIPFDELPHSFNPPSGIIATANGRIVPDDYPYFISARWEAPFRTARIFELLRTGGPFDSADMLRIQTDILSREDQWLAKELLTAATKQPPADSDSQNAIDVIKKWDGQARSDSAATLVLEVTRHALLNRILMPKLGSTHYGYTWPMSTIFLQNVMEGNLVRWLPPGDADFNITLMRSLNEGVSQIPNMVHSQDQAAWKWGNTIPLTFHHPLGGLPFLGKLLDVGPFPQAGTGTTVKQTTPYLGPSMRMIVDFADLDRSLQNITLGESGQPFSPYYRDQFAAWYGGQSLPMLFSDSAVERGAVHKLLLEPH
jgi:penicillin G amidase